MPSEAQNIYARWHLCEFLETFSVTLLGHILVYVVTNNC